MEQKIDIELWIEVLIDSAKACGAGNNFANDRDEAKKKIIDYVRELEAQAQ